MFQGHPLVDHNFTEKNKTTSSAPVNQHLKLRHERKRYRYNGFLRIVPIPPAFMVESKSRFSEGEDQAAMLEEVSEISSRWCYGAVGLQNVLSWTQLPFTCGFAFGKVH